jgi:hypothetical protein
MGTLTADFSLRTVDTWFSSDAQMNLLYPKEIQLLDRKHWTPLSIANISVEFLTPHKDVKILDIGSGVGKFCLAGAYLKPWAQFFGVEQREHLVTHAETARQILEFENVTFLNKNLTQLNFKQFDHFYFFNSFYENLMDTDKIDESIVCSPHLYNYYNRYMCKQLSEMRVGTRLVTFHSLDDKVPPNYELVEIQYGNMLKFWLKVA